MACSTTVDVSPAALRVLSHPVFWCCTVALALNDHLLKGAGVLPGWLTGKLSDVAGLVVAPVLAACLLGGARLGPRLLAFALPVLVFVAIKVSPPAARALEAMMGAIGVPWRIWTDPTDLLALAVLPLGWRLVHRPWCRPASRSRSTAGAILGAAACLATSAPADDAVWTTDAWVANLAGPVDLRVRWVRGDLDCDRVEPRFADVLGKGAFDEGVTFALQDRDTIPLDRTAAQSAAGFDAVIPAGPDGCDAVMLQAEGLPSTVVFWRRFSTQSIQPSMPFTDPGEGAVVLEPRLLEDLSSRLTATGRRRVEVAPLIEAPVAEACPGADEGGTFSWSETAQGEGSVTIESLDRGPDGCFVLTLREGEGRSYFFLCIPAAAFPFAAGDRVELQHLTTEDQRSLRLRRDAPAAELVIFSGVSAIDSDGVAGEMVDAGCGGERLGCGAFVLPGGFRVEHASVDDEDEPTVARGGSVELDLDEGRTVVMVGRVERTVLAHPECPVGRDSLGMRGDVLILRQEVSR